MKKILMLFCLGMAFVKVNAQEIDARIKELYGAKTQEIAQNDPERINVMTDLVQNRIKLVDSPVSGQDKYVKLSTRGLQNKYNAAMTRDIVFDPLNFNPLKYDLDFFSTQAVIYRVDNTDYLIVIQPQTLKQD